MYGALATTVPARFKHSWAAPPSLEYQGPVEFPRVSVPVGCRVSQAEYREAGEHLAVAFLVGWPLSAFIR
jgi:hypothetical protein